MFAEYYSLHKLNTFGVDVKARYYICLDEIRQLKEIMPVILKNDLNFLILGEGSNILFTRDFNGVVIHNCLKGFEIYSEDEHGVLVRAFAGENWDKFVARVVEKGYGGIENLSLIPGSVGSSPVQNIGAYGVEVRNRIVHVEGYTLPDLELRLIKNEHCRFGYRNSIFKNELKNRFLITAVVFRLDKHPVFELRYGAIAELFCQKSVQDLTTLRETITEIRRNKLPDPELFGNAGSFFKNPVIANEQFQVLKKQWDDIPGHSSGDDSIKVSAAWLIDKAGWKGIRVGNVGTWKLQPLVIINYGNASGEEILKFSDNIRKSVLEKFGIELMREVNVI